MTAKCPVCLSVDFSRNFIHDAECQRCLNFRSKSRRASALRIEPEADDLGAKLDAGAIWFFKRFAAALVVSLALLLIAYFSMLHSAERLSAEQAATVERAIAVLESRDFKSEAWWLRLANFRQNDNWFNALAGHNDAYAATNFPFEIVTLYPDFFALTVDDIERAAVLLHEAEHLQGAGEPAAYEKTWRARRRLGWTRNVYGDTRVYRNVQQSTAQLAPEIFVCAGNFLNDCTD